MGHRGQDIDADHAAGKRQTAHQFIDRLREQASAWGWAIGTRYGEGFATREPVGLSSLRMLL